MTSAGPKPVRKSRRGLYLPYLALALVCLGWSAYWMIAASATEGALTDWFAQEEHLGRLWSCPQRSVGGFPFRIEVRCTKPSFSGRLGAMTGMGSVGDFLAAANLYNPSLVVVEVASPFAFHTSDETLTLSLAWKELHASHRSRYGDFERGSLELEAPSLHVEGKGFAPLNGKAAAFETQLRSNPDDPSALDVAFRANGVVAEGLDALTGEAAPLDAILSATIRQAAAASGGNAAAILERWRLGGGRVDLQEFKAAKGTARIEADGRLDLDALHRLRGSLNLGASGIAPLLQRFGLPAGGLVAGGLLGGLLGAKASAPSGVAVPGQELKLTLNLDNGRATTGPLRLPLVLNPVY